MQRFNLSKWAIEHHTLMAFFMILIFVSGIWSYFRLGQNEDPNFTIQTMVVRAYLPGASMEETTKQLTDRLEKKLQETPHLKYVKSYTLPGETTIYVTLLPSTSKNDVPDCWYQVRKKMGDIKHELPSETVGPFFNDEFGDVYGIIYAFTADGFTHRELKDYVEDVRRELLRIQDVEKVTVIGAQDEKIYVEFSPHTLANLGISRNAIVSALARQNALTPSGVADTGSERIVIETTGRFLDAKDIASVNVHANGRSVRLGDIATVRKGLQDPPDNLFRCNGQDAIGLGISMSKGGDVLLLEKNMNRAMEQIKESLPLGIEVHLVSNQPSVVRMAVHDFMKTLFEAIVIVLGLSFLSLGLRAGTVVAFSIPFVLALTFVGMFIFNIDLQRVSLGALIISLGLLVDDAMITIESMVSRLEKGWKLKDAACYAYTATAFPMLTGTLVTIFGFIPIGLTKSMAGEYCFSLFAVVALSLLFSWFVAVLFAPALGMKVLYEGYKPKAAGSHKVQQYFKAMLHFAVDHPRKTVAITLTVFCLSLAGIRFIPMQFFPQSERPELLVDITLRQGMSIEATDKVSKRLDELLQKDRDVDHWSSYVGKGAERFYLPMDVQLPNTSYTQTVVITKDTEARARVQERLYKALGEEFPEVLLKVAPMEMGPPVGWPVGYRVTGPDIRTVEKYAREVAAVMRGYDGVKSISFNWMEQGRKLSVNVRQEEARRLGLSSSDIAQTVYSAVSGATITQVRDDIYLTDVVLRADAASRKDIASIEMLDIQLPNGKSVPLGTVAQVDYVQEYPLVWRRDRLPAITVQADVTSVTAATAVAQMKKDMDAIRARLPFGFHIDDAGTVEESATNIQAVVDTVPVMVLCILIVLMIQLQNFRYLFLVLSVAPLGLIGVVAGLLFTGSAMGYVALLGVVSLIGMIVRNSVILVHQIDLEKESGKNTMEAVIAASEVRFRPIMLTAVAAIMGMYPIASTSFWGPMAYAIMGGLAVATVLTLVFIPALYVLIFHVPPEPAPLPEKPAEDEQAEEKAAEAVQPDA